MFSWENPDLNGNKGEQYIWLNIQDLPIYVKIYLFLQNELGENIFCAKHTAGKVYIEDVEVIILFHLLNVLFNVQMHDSVVTHKSAYSIFHRTKHTLLCQKSDGSSLEILSFLL